MHYVSQELRAEEDESSVLMREMAKEIEVSTDHVAICGQVVYRPARISRMMWVDFWETIAS